MHVASRNGKNVWARKNQALRRGEPHFDDLSPSGLNPAGRNGFVVKPIGPQIVLQGDDSRAPAPESAKTNWTDTLNSHRCDMLTRPRCLHHNRFTTVDPKTMTGQSGTDYLQKARGSCQNKYLASPISFNAFSEVESSTPSDFQSDFKVLPPPFTSHSVAIVLIKSCRQPNQNSEMGGGRERRK
jgi:hypothetical protein